MSRGRTLGAILVVALSIAGLSVTDAGAVESPHPAPAGGTRTLAQLATGTRVPIAAALGAADPRYWVRGLRADDPAGHLSMSFSSAGAEIRGGGTTVRLSPLAAGRGAPVARRNRVTYAGADVREWYANGPLGLEQGFTVEHPPAGSGHVILSQVVSGARLSQPRDGEVLLGRGLRYGGLRVTDATGRSMPAELGVSGHRLQIAIDAGGARYPLRVDPVVQEAELSPPTAGGAAGTGTAVAAAGDTIAVGDPQYDASGDRDQLGAVFVFEEHGGTWANATPDAVLTASDPNASAQLGFSVAMSGDTIVAGAIGRSSSPAEGAVYVFVKPSGGWANTTQTAELNASTGQAGDNLGQSVGISGNTVVAGVPYFGTTTPGDFGGTGAALVWVEPPTGWSSNLTQTAILTASDGATDDELGRSVAISGDTVVAGAPDRTISNADSLIEQGAAYVFTEPGSGWANMTQTAELDASGSGSYDRLGSSVAISGDTAAASAPGHTNPNGNGYTQQGAVDLFDLPATGTVQQTSQITAPGGGTQGEAFGSTIALAGTVLVASDHNAFYLFPALTAGENEELEPSDFSSNSYSPAGVAVDGGTAVVGGYNPFTGSPPGDAYVYPSGATPSAPAVTTDAASAVTSSSAALDATITAGGADTNYVYEYGTSAGSLGSTFPAVGRFGAGSGTSAIVQHTQTLTGLLAGTTYYYEACATNAVTGATPVCGRVQSFRTPGTAPPPPGASTAAATAVTGTTATLNGTVDPTGVVTTYVFEWGTSAGSLTNMTQVTDAGSGSTAVPVSAGLSGLAPSTTYYAALVATSAAGTTDGQTLNFTTAATSSSGSSGSGSSGSGSTGSGSPGSGSHPTSPTVSVGHATVRGTAASIQVTCQGTSNCPVTVSLSVPGTPVGQSRLVAGASATQKAKGTTKAVVIGSTKTTVGAGRHTTVKVSLNATGKHLEKAHPQLKAELTVSISGRQAASTTVTFHRPRAA
jgi:hypothetical protein